MLELGEPESPFSADLEPARRRRLQAEHLQDARKRIHGSRYRPESGPGPRLRAGLVHASMLFFYTPGGAEQLFVEGGDEPQPGVQVQPWGPERIDERLLSLLDKYDTQLPG